MVYESVALESNGPGGHLVWKEHMSGHWSAQGLGGRYDVYPRGVGGYTAYWSQAGTGSTHEIGNYDTIGQAFGAARRHADGERRQAAAEESGVGADVARKSVASAYGAGQVESVSGSGSRYTVTLKSGKRLHVAVDGSTGTVTDPEDGHTVATHTVSEAAECNECGCAHKHPKSVPTKACEEHRSRREALGLKMHHWHSGMSDPLYAVGSLYVQGRTYPDRERVEAALTESERLLRQKHSDKDKKELRSIHAGLRFFLKKDYGAEASETVPVIHEANDAGAFATVDRDTTELAKGHALGKATKPMEIYEMVHKDLDKESQEVFLVIPLDLHGQALSRPVEVARGQRDRVSVGISDVMRPVAASNAKGFVVVHNHPSGHARPSPKDKELTDTIRKHTFPDVTFLDHIVVGNKEFYSFTEAKLFKVR
jgi:DNA repair protein RadC